MNAKRTMHRERLEDLLAEIPTFKGANAHDDRFKVWRRRVSNSLDELLGEDHRLAEAFQFLRFWETRMSPVEEGFYWAPEDQSIYEGDLVQAESIMRDALDEILTLDGVPRTSPPKPEIEIGTGAHPTRDELVMRLADHEDSFVERKTESASPSEYRRTLVAYANSIPRGRTAVLFIGVSDSGQPLGISNPDSKQKDIRRLCTEDCAPPVRVFPEVLTIDGKSVLAVVVPHSTEVPHFAGLAFIRKGSESVRATHQEMVALFTMRNSLTRAILQSKGSVVTIEVMGRRLGTNKALVSSFRDTLECVVEDCDSHTVILRDIRTGRTCPEPLTLVSLSKDAVHNRLKIVVDGR